MMHKYKSKLVIKKNYEPAQIVDDPSSKYPALQEHEAPDKVLYDTTEHPVQLDEVDKQVPHV